MHVGDLFQNTERLNNMASTSLTYDDVKTSIRTQILSLGVHNPLALPVLINVTDNTTILGGNYKLISEIGLVSVHLEKEVF